jgi:POT family proton-dependent oligopeptide transporter
LLTACIVIIPTIIFFDKSLTAAEKKKVAVIFVVCFFVIFFWGAFEQAGASLSFFADEQTQRQVGKFTVPASWFQSLNSAFVVLFAPFFAWFWLKLGSKEPSSPTKMALGLLLLALGYLWIAHGVDNIQPGVKVSMIWLTGMYALHTSGELCLSPIGMSLVNKLSPAKFLSLLMAIWFTANAFGNKLAGVLSSVYPPGVAEIKKAKENGIDLGSILYNHIVPSADQIKQLHTLEIPYTFKTFLGYHINNLYDFFMLFVFMAGTASLILFLVTKKLQKMMQAV